MDETIKEEIKALLIAYPVDLTRQALRELSLARREERIQDGWQLWTGEGVPPKPFEWRRLGGVVHYRNPPPRADATVSTTAQRRSNVSATARICPFCGAEAFPQSVCPKCAKGKAGIRKQYLCGENDSHIFFTE